MQKEAGNATVLSSELVTKLDIPWSNEDLSIYRRWFRLHRPVCTGLGSKQTRTTQVLIVFFFAVWRNILLSFIAAVTAKNTTVKNSSMIFIKLIIRINSAKFYGTLSSHGLTRYVTDVPSEIVSCHATITAVTYRPYVTHPSKGDGSKVDKTYSLR